MIFDIAVDPAAVAAVPEGIVPAPIIAPAPAEAWPVEAGAPVWTKSAAPAIRTVVRVADLPAVDRVAELHEHRRALRIGGRRVAVRLQLLGDQRGVALEL